MRRSNPVFAKKDGLLREYIIGPAKPDPLARNDDALIASATSRNVFYFPIPFSGTISGMKPNTLLLSGSTTTRTAWTRVSP
ncbi:MAG: hypothetical protein OJF48_004169 [Afipia sp.]|nr:MAG: hypothetical protein OJF48_004169 [Afipia sp.]